MLHADQEFAVASTSKIGILYALLREVDLGNESWTAEINSGDQYGNNQGNWVSADTDYTIAQMAGFMIRSSNNWATNRLIQRIGRATINQHLDGLGLNVTRIHRYMLGTGSPSAHGNGSAYQDHVEGWENLSTPREMVTLLRKVRNDNVLGPLSELRFWATLKLDGNNDGINNKSYVPSFVNPLFNPAITFFNKPGNVDDIRAHRADAGAMAMPDGEVVLYAIFMTRFRTTPTSRGSLERDPQRGDQRDPQRRQGGRGRVLLKISALLLLLLTAACRVALRFFWLGPRRRNGPRMFTDQKSMTISPIRGPILLGGESFPAAASRYG